MQIIDTAFEGGTIDLKDGVFVRCTFKDCTLLVQAGSFLFVGLIQFKGVVRVMSGANRAAQRLIAEACWQSGSEGRLVFD